MPTQVRLVGGPADGKHLPAADAERAEAKIEVAVVDGCAVTPGHSIFRGDPDLTAHCTWTTYHLTSEESDGLAEYRVASRSVEHAETRHRITTALQEAGVGNDRRIEPPTPGGTRWSVLLEDTTTTIAAIRTLSGLRGVSRVRRRPHRSQELFLEVTRPGGP